MSSLHSLLKRRRDHTACNVDVVHHCVGHLKLSFTLLFALLQVVFQLPKLVFELFVSFIPAVDVEKAVQGILLVLDLLL